MTDEFAASASIALDSPSIYHDLPMLSGAHCTFMGNGLTLVSQPTPGGAIETAAIGVLAYTHALKTWEAGRGPDWLDGAQIGNVFYQWMDATLVHMMDIDAGETVVLSLDDVKAALGVLTH